MTHSHRFIPVKILPEGNRRGGKMFARGLPGPVRRAAGGCPGASAPSPQYPGSRAPLQGGGGAQRPPPPFGGLPAPGSAYQKYACAVLGRPSRSDGASASPRLPTLPGTGPSLPLPCASSPYSTVFLSPSARPPSDARVLAEALAHLPAGHARQGEIEGDEVGPFLPRERQALVAVRGREYRGAVVLEHGGEEHTNVGLVRPAAQ